jgi:antitoxin component of MazEF toxin-antitoxin module
MRRVAITPVVSEECSLEKLLVFVTAENIHHEVDTGCAVGEEAWELK